MLFCSLLGGGGACIVKLKVGNRRNSENKENKENKENSDRGLKQRWESDKTRNRIEFQRRKMDQDDLYAFPYLLPLRAIAPLLFFLLLLLLSL